MGKAFLYFLALSVLAGLPPQASAQSASGVLREVWTHVAGTTVPELTSSPNFPAAPVMRVVDPDFRAPVDWAENYGVRMRALLTPTTTGNHTFWVCGDDNCELWLSSTASPDNRVKIATVPGWTPALTWNKFSQQKSAAIALVAGQSYYIEALMKEGGGGDSLAVAWAAAPSTTPVVIPGSVLTPYEQPGPPPSGLVVEAGRVLTQYAPNFSFMAHGQTLDLAKPNETPTVVWSKVSGPAATMLNPDTISTQINVTAAGTYVFRLTARDSAGTTASDDLTVVIRPKLAPDAGNALAEYWFGVGGTSLASLSSSQDYPGFPHGHRIVRSLTSPVSLADQYGERVRGFILVPASGAYRFFLAADETAEFRLSTDDSPANLSARCAVTKAVGVNEHFATPGQASAFVNLEAGKRYAFEILHKEEWGGDHVSLLWQQPGTDYATDITSEFLAPPADSAKVTAAAQEFKPEADFLLNAGRDGVLYLPRNSASLSAWESRRVWGADTPVRTWSQVSGPPGVVFSTPAAAQTGALFPKAGVYVLRYSVKTNNNTTTDDVRVEVRAPLTANSGWLTRQVWWNKQYATLDALRADPAFPNQPDITDNVTELRQVNDWADRYATRVTGLLRVPPDPDKAAEVNYTFWVAGDDAVEFSISTDASPANLRRVCFATKPSGRENWKNEASQTSALVALKPGATYFVELLHRETWSSDYFAVAWARQGDSRPQVIDGGLFEPSVKAAAFNTSTSYYASAGRDLTYYWPHDRVTLKGSIIKLRDTGAATTVTWRQTAGPKATLTSTSEMTTEAVCSATGVYTFEFTVTEGANTHRDSVNVTLLKAQTGITGFLTRSVWFDISGYALADLTNSDPTLASPHYEDLLPGVEPPVNWADYTGTRLKGFLTVPTSGNYTFWIASDDASELKLDLQDGNGLRRVAHLNNAVAYRNYDGTASQKSATFALTAGTAYPLEIVQKEHDYNDHLSVAMEGPATNGREVLSRGFLNPFKAAAPFNPEITVSLGPDRTILWPGNQVVLAALVYDLKAGPKAVTYKWSSTSTKVTFDSPTSPVSGVKFGGPGAYEIKMTATDGQFTGVDTILVTVKSPLNTTSGGLLREVWTGIPGYTLNDLRNSAAYAKAPTISDTLPSLEAPTSWGDNYGQRLTGCIQVPEEADYVFLLASDEESEFWLNPNGEDAAGAQKAAFTQWATGRYNWTRYPSQTSAAVRLVPGKKYYLQVLHKEGTGDDYLAVAYRRADQPNSAATVVPGVLLSPPAGAKTSAFDGEMTVEAGQNQEGFWPRARYTVRGVAADYIPGPQPMVYRWSVLSGPSGAATQVLFNAPTALVTDVEFPAGGTYQLQLTATDGLITRSDSLTITIGAPLAPGTGSLLAETFRNISGSWVTDLVKNPKFPNSPDDRMQIRSAEIPSNQGDNYGMLIRGFIHPPVTGVYRFNLASDEWSEVYLSTDRAPENKSMIAFVPAATDYYEWRKFPDYQLSRPITLTKGKSYYVEIRFKESGWRDHLALAWLRPGASSFEVIDGAFLAPWEMTDKVAPVITLAGGPDVVWQVGSPYVDPGFTATDSVDGDVSGGVKTEGTVDVNTPGTYLVRYTVKDASGNVSTVAVRRVTVAVAEGTPGQHPADASGSHSTAPWSPAGAITDMEAARFLIQASFGPTEESIARVKAIGYSAWIDEQLALPPSCHLAAMDRIARYQSARTQLLELSKTAGTFNLMPGSMMPMSSSMLRTDDRLWAWWTMAATAPDQLRQRAAFALSEILVISDRGSTLQNYPRGVAAYYDLLVKHANGNYRNLMEDVTLNPMMGVWLTMLRSSKARPDENYPREIMQLFSVGLEHLNLDGTFKRDGQGNAIPTYGQNEILELSRTFTGWTFSKSPSFTWSSSPVDDITPMMPFEDYHDRGRKVILGGATIPAGQTALQDVRRALDVICAHPNVGPFLAKRLIQRMVTSNPSPAYVYRVALKFNDNGKGVRGDMGAVFKAILLDPEARNPGSASSTGKLGEPIVRLTRLLRAFPKPPSANPPVLGRYALSNVGDAFGQSPFQSPTVFNFFHTDFKPQGPILDAGLVAPEFEITTELSTVDTANYFFDTVVSGAPTNIGPRIGLELAPLQALWSTPEVILTRLETLLLGRPMSAGLRSALMTVHAANLNAPQDGVRAMIQVITASPEFSVER